MEEEAGKSINLSESEIKGLDFESLDEAEKGNNANEYLPPPPSFYKYEPAPATLEDALQEIDFLRKRMVRRMEIIDAVRRAYLKDVVTVRMEHLKLVDEYNLREAQLAAGAAPGLPNPPGPPNQAEDQQANAQVALQHSDTASVMTGGYYSVSENLHHNVPSLDMRYFLPLHAPAESYLVVKRCPACGGHLEVIKHESKKIKRLTKEVEGYKESEKRAQGREKRLKAQIIDAELKLSEQQAKNKIDQEIMNRKVLELKSILKTKVDAEDLEKVHAKVRSEKKKYEILLKELDVIPQLRAKIIEHEEQVKRLETEVHRDKFNLKTVKQEKQNLEVSLKDVMLEKRTTEKKLKDTKKELTSTVEEREVLKIQLEESKARVEKLEGHIANSTQKDSSNQLQMMNLEAEMREQLEAEELRNEELDEKLSEAKSQIRKLMQQVASLNGGKMPDLPGIDAGGSNEVEEMFAMEAAEMGDQSMRPGSPPEQQGGGRRTRRRRAKGGRERGDRRRGTKDRGKDPKQGDGSARREGAESTDAEMTSDAEGVSRLGTGDGQGKKSRKSSTMSAIIEKDEEIEALKKEIKIASDKVDEEVKGGQKIAPKSIKTQIKKMKILMKTYDRKFKTEKKAQVGLMERIEMMDRELEKRRLETGKLLSLIDPDVLEKNKTFIMDYGGELGDGNFELPASTRSSNTKLKVMFIPRRGAEGTEQGSDEPSSSGQRGSSFLHMRRDTGVQLPPHIKEALKNGESIFTQKELDEMLAEKQDFLNKEFEDQCGAFREEIQAITNEKKNVEEEARNLRKELMETKNELDLLHEEMQRLRQKFQTENSSTNLAAQKMAQDVGSLRMEYEIATVALEKAKAEVKTMKEKLEKADNYGKKLKHELKIERDNKQSTLDQVNKKAKALSKLMIFVQQATHRIHAICTHSRPKTSDKNRSVEVIQVDKIMRLVQQGGENESRMEEISTMLGEQPIVALSEYAEELTTQAILHVEAEIEELVSRREEEKKRLQAEIAEKSKAYEDKIDKLEKALTKANTDLESMKRAALTEVGTLKEQAERYKKTIAELEAQMAVSKNQLMMVEEFKKKAMVQQKEIFQQKKKIEELNRKIKDLEYDNEQLDFDLHNTKADLTNMTAERDDLQSALKRSQQEAEDYKQKYEAASRRLSELIEADRHRLATNVSIACEVKPNHFTHDKQIQTEFVTPEMTLRQVNNYHKYPFQSTGAPFVKPQVKNAEPPLWALRSEFGATSAGAPTRKDFLHDRPWTEGSFFAQKSSNQESSMFTEFDQIEDQQRPFTALGASGETHRAKYFGIEEQPSKSLVHSSSTGTLDSSLTGGRIGPEISLPMVQRHSSKLLPDSTSFNPPSPQLPRLSR